MDCLFCKIIAREVDANIVYEDDKVIAFLDINPVNPGHVLVLPKNHIETLLDLPDKDTSASMSVVKKMMKAVLNLPDTDGVNLIQNNYSAAGQVITHVHFHIIPRKIDDGYRHWPGTSYQDGEAEKVAVQIKNNLEKNN